MHARRLPKFAAFGAATALALVIAAGLRAATGDNGSASLSGPYLQDFGPDGYKTWAIQSRESHINPTDDSRIEISELLLRLYSGGEKPHLEMTIKSAVATVKNSDKETQVNGPDIIYLTGANDSYSVSGYNWWWNSKSHLIHLGRGVTVKFNSTASANSTAAAQPPHPIIILSNTLDIDQQTGKNLFTFKGNISIADQDSKSDPKGEFHTTCNVLEVVAARATAGSTTTPAASAAPLNNLPASLSVDKDSVESIVAQDNVVLRQGAIEAKGGRAQLYPSEEKVVLSDTPQVRVTLSGNATEAANYALMEGGRITWLRDTQVLDLEPIVADAASTPGMVKVSLPSKSPPYPGATEARIDVTGEALHAQFGAERRFDIEKSVHVDDPRYTINAQHLDAEFDAPVKDDKAAPGVTAPAPGQLPLTVENTPSQLGKLNHLALSKDVVIQQSNLKATTPNAEILPDEQAILLSGGPHVEDTLSNTTIDAATMKLTMDGRDADIHGTPGKPAQLALPSLPLGQSSVNIATTILSDSVKMKRGLENSTFTFSDNVQVNASSLEITSGQLNVETNNVHTQSGVDASSDPTKRVQIIQLLARDHVLITQPDGFKAAAAVAEVDPEVATPDINPGNASSSNAKAFRLLQLHGDPTGLTGPVKPEVYIPMQNFNNGAAPAGSSPAPVTTTAKITSDEQWLFTSPEASNYMFMGNVTIDTGFFKMTCDRMQVNCAKAPDSANASIPHLSVDNIIAEGHVRLEQNDKDQRVSTSDKALITPRDDKALLTGNVIVTNNSGYRMQNAEITIVMHPGKPPEITTTPASPGDALKRPTIIMQSSGTRADFLKKPAEKDSNNSGH